MKYTDICEQLHQILVTEGADTIRISTVQRRFKLGFNNAQGFLAFLEQRDCGNYLEDGVRFTVDLDAIRKLVDRKLMKRKVCLDVETTGIDPAEGHRVIEIGCLEITSARTGNHFHQYLNPEREIDEGAFTVHGLSNEFLADKPVFAQVAEDLLNFIRGAELFIFNAPFDLGFLNQELRALDAPIGRIEDMCQVTDVMAIARKKHPGQRNSLDALCKRYNIDSQHRSQGALQECEILANVYQAMMKVASNAEG